jgi:hypothetical protein
MDQAVQHGANPPFLQVFCVIEQEYTGASDNFSE